MRGLLPRLLAIGCVLIAGLGPAAADIQVEVTAPSFLKPVFGEVEITAEVTAPAGETITKVEFYLDRRLIGTDTQPPYTLLHDVGQENQERLFQVIAYGASGQRGRGEVDTPAFRVDDQLQLELQQLYVTFTRGGERVLDLQRDALQVYDNDRQQELVTFERGDVPLTAVLLVDVSESMAGDRLQAALRGAATFVKDLRPLDEAMVMLFADHLVRVTDFSSEPESLVAALDDVEAGGGTALNDHLYMALNYLDSRQGRRVAIVLSDGIDLFSVLRMRDVLWRARRSQAIIYWIYLGDPEADAGQGSSWRNVASNAEEFDQLSRAVEQSGGRVELPADAEQLEQAYRDILQELREQYVLGYYPTDLKGDGSWRPVKVKVREPGIDVRSREGYIDF